MNDVAIKKNATTGGSRGLAVVSFRNESDAALARKETDGKVGLSVCINSPF